MTTYLIIAAGAAVIVAVVWIAIRAATSQARNAGAAEQRAGDQTDARAAEREMTDIMLGPTSPAETKDKLRKGEF